jgi:hypothetical protein
MSGTQLIPLGAGIVSALLHLSVASGSPGALMIAYFAQLPLAATGLSLGAMQGAVASAVAAVIVALAAPGGGSLTLLLTITLLPVKVVVFLALRNAPADNGAVAWYPLGRIMAALAALALAIFAVALVVFSGSEDGLQGAVNRYLVAFADVYQVDNRETIEAFMLSAARVFPGAAAVSWLVMVIVNCGLAQQFLCATGRNIRPKPTYRDVETVLWPAIAALAGAILMIFGGFPGFVGLNVLIVALVPFFFIGLAVLHSISAAWPGRPLLLVGVYIFLVLLLWPAAIVALLGIAENWMRLRDRAAASRTNKGND